MLMKRVSERVKQAAMAAVVAGMVVLGSTGEAPMLSDDETRQVLRTAAAAPAPEKGAVAWVGRGGGPPPPGPTSTTAGGRSAPGPAHTGAAPRRPRRATG